MNSRRSKGRDARTLVRSARRALILNIFVFFAGLPSVADGAAQATKTARRDPPTRQQVDQAIEMAAAYMLRSVQADGRFVYRINLDPRVALIPKYNMLRHAGAMYALAAYHEFRGDKASRRVLIEAGRFLHSQIGSIPGHSDLMAVWSRPSVSGSGQPTTAKLGGAGLGLIALTELERIEPGFTPLARLRELGQFVLHMQNEDGSFCAKYTPAYGGRDDRWVSLYYPGEAALGLLMLYERDADPRWLQGSADAIAFLAQSRAGARSLPPDHWALIATAKLLPLYDRCEKRVPRNVVVQHAARICQQMVEAQLPQDDHPELYGCFQPDGRTTPTATRLEGLLASLPFLPQDRTPLRRDVVAACHRGVAFLLRSQVTEGDARGAIPRAIRPLPEIHQSFDEAFRRRVSEVRIDYVQHVLSALVEYRDLFLSEGGALKPPAAHCSQSSPDSAAPSAPVSPAV